MNAWKVILATLVIFGAGVLTGQFAWRCTPHTQAVAQQSAPLPTPTVDGMKGTNRIFSSGTLLMPKLRKEFLKNLDAELQLTAEQRERIERILCDGQQCTKQLWDQISPQVQEKWKCVKNSILGELNDEQKARFEEFMKRSQKDSDSPHPSGQPLNGAPKAMSDVPEC